MNGTVGPIAESRRAILDSHTRERYYRGMDTIPLDTVPAPSEPISTVSAADRRTSSYDRDKDKILARLRRMEGQVRGVQRMVEEDQYCLDVLTQLSAIMAAARTAGLLVMEDHIRGCVMGTCRHGHTDQEELLDELTGAIERFTRTAG